VGSGSSGAKSSVAGGTAESAGRASCGTAGCRGNFAETFAFDIHALIKSENAPALETKLHHIFRDHQVNKNNFRKEFFRNDFCDDKSLR